MKSGKTRSVNSNKTKSTQNCLELMENQLSSSGILPRIHIEILRQIQKDLKTPHIHPEQLEGILLTSMFSDIDWTKTGKEFPLGHWSSLGPGNVENSMGRMLTNLKIQMGAAGRITKIQTLVDKLQDGYRTKSIMNDLKQDGTSNVFSEASRHKIKEMGNIEF